MIETLHSDHEMEGKQPSEANSLANVLNGELQKFSRNVEFQGLDYEAKRKKVNKMTQKIAIIFMDGHVDRRQNICTAIREILKNSADHSGSDMKIEMELHRDKSSQKMHIRFAFHDEGPGLPYEEEQIKQLFTVYGRPDDRKRKGNYNFGVGLGMIRSGLQNINIDVKLHNHGKVIHLVDCGFQSQKKNTYTFGYEGIGILDIVE